LWFDVVPDHEMGSRILQTYRAATGVTERYNDVTSEIALRKDIYTTLHQAVRLQLERLRSDLKDKADSRRVAQDSNRNLLIGAFGVAFAIPGVLQMSPLVDTWSGFWISAGVIVAALVIAWVVYQRSNTDESNNS
jgi:VIT1/CCC1 family predicted Fe2+/Mn2+ transporter